MDQNRFTTILTGDEVIRELFLSHERRATFGDAFQLDMYVSVSSQDSVQEHEWSVYADRVDAPAYTHPSGEVVIETFARLTPGGEPFKISVTPPLGTSHIQGASVTISPEMSQIFQRQLERRNDPA